MSPSNPGCIPSGTNINNQRPSHGVISDSIPQKRRPRILPAAALKDKPAGSYLVSWRCKDCACAIHVIQDDRTVMSVKFDSVNGGFVKRGSENSKVYVAVEDFIVEHGELFRNPVAEVGVEDNFPDIDIVKTGCVNSCRNSH